MVLLEVCVDSILSAVNASEAGADRIELCSALSEGGLTPSVGLFQGVKKAMGNSRTKIFCMIRIRRGDFHFSEDEIEAMIEDVKYFKQHEADGIVIGCLNQQNEINVESCRRLITAWGSEKPITFHRAFDETDKAEFRRNIETLQELGIKRLLSSGFESSAEQGRENLQKITAYGAKRGISVMPGAGINKSNVLRIISETGCKEIHASARSASKSSTVSRLSMGGGGEPLMVCDSEKVKDLIEVIRTL